MQCCETCINWKKIKETDEGDCRYKVIFPDSRFARATGMLKTMLKGQGTSCPAYSCKDKPDKNFYSHRLMLNED